MKKYLYLFLFFISLKCFSITEYQIDEYWKHYIYMNSELTKLLKNVRSISDYDSFKKKAKELIRINKDKIVKFQFQREDISAVFARYRYHIKNRTTLGVKLQAVSIAFMTELRRIDKMPGGKEFLKENNLFLRPKPPTQSN